MKDYFTYAKKHKTASGFACMYTWMYLTVFVLLSFFSTGIHAQTSANTSEGYDEISITLNVQRIGNIEIPAIIHNDVVYLPIKDLFDFLNIKNTVSADNDSLGGFFITPEAKYLISKASNRLIYRNKTYDLKSTDLIRTETNLYLKSDFFAQIFGLDCAFIFRSLSVNLTTKLELPAIREMQIELMHKNLSKLKGEKKADTVIGRSYPLFHLGMADWSVLASQQKDFSSTKAYLSLGAILAGGEADVSLNYDNNSAFDKRQQYYAWRFVNNDNALLRQVTAGKIFAQSIATVYAPITGVQFTNTPTTYRKSFGTYTLSDKTDPGWTVELYINNVLVNYTKADASGFFTFQVPMIYGNSVVKLRFYSPYGEERYREENVSVPFNFIPVHQFEYSETAGIVQDEEKGKYSRTNFSYGFNRHITLGGGLEYLSTVASGKAIPFLNTSMRVGSNILISGEHAYGVRTKGLFTFRLPSNLQIDLQYSKYNKQQTAVRFNYLEEKKAVLSLPFSGEKYSVFTRLTVNQFKLTKYSYTSAELLMSSIIAGVSSNLTTYMLLTDPVHKFVYTNMSLNFRLPAGIRFTPQMQYEYIQKNFSMLKTEVEKNLFNKGFINLSFQKDLINKITTTTIGIRYNFSVAQTSISTTNINGVLRTSQSAKGSLMYDDRTKFFEATDLNTVGKGGVILTPFLDLNCNGKRDANEPKVAGLKLHVNGGRVQHNLKDTTVRVLGLEAYTNYYLELANNCFDNIAWQLRKPVISVIVDPNHFKSIDVPVAVVGEASGTVYANSAKGRTGLGRIIVDFYDSTSHLVSRTVTEPDGFFTFMGFPPGKYTAHVDQVQLQKLHMKASPAIQEFTIKQNIDGDVVDDLKFIVTTENALQIQPTDKTN